VGGVWGGCGWCVGVVVVGVGVGGGVGWVWGVVGWGV
jgi:hypothetical protein